MTRDLKLVLAMHASELRVLLVLVVAWTLAATLVSWLMSGITSAFPECFGHLPTGIDCAPVAERFLPYERVAQLLLGVTRVAPFVVGLILGVTVVGREIEQGTAVLAWSLSPDRRRWLVWRLLPVAVAAGALLTAFAIGGEFLLRGRLGAEDPGFVGYEERGLLVLARVALALGIGTLVGTLAGRTLSALLIGAAVVAAMLVVQTIALNAWRVSEATVVSFEAIIEHPELFGGLPVDQVAILPDGTVTEERDAELLPDEYLDAQRILPPSTFWTWMIRETSLSIGLAVVAVGATALCLGQRRPT